MRGKSAPHQSSLRNGRWSCPNHCYFVTVNAAGKEPLFTNPQVAQVVVDSFCWLQGQGRIRLMGFVIMPDHVHVAFVLRGAEGLSRAEARSYNGAVGAPFRARSGLAQVMNSFKGFTGKKINGLLGHCGQIWQSAYHDHLVRDRKDFETRLRYMHGNPVRKGLSQFEYEYEFSTANPNFAHLVDWVWLDGIGNDRGREAAPTESLSASSARDSFSAR